jgi:diacylglycerol O-acyltransferase-1
MIPTIKNSIKYIHNDDYFNIIERILKLAIPTVYGWIIMFYAFFHSWLNLWAEITKYGDRKFYKDWWNSLYLDEYWRTWNLVSIDKQQHKNLLADPLLAYETCLQPPEKKKI